MKHSVIMSLALSALAPIAAFAAESSSASSQADFGKLTFFPKKGEFVNNTNAKYVSETVKGKDSDSFVAKDVTGNTFELKDSLSYSFLPKGFVTLSWAYQNLSVTDMAQSSGLVNPEVSFTYRILEQAEHSINLDLTAGFAPSLFDNKSASEDKEGTVASGNNQFFAKATISGEANQFVWSVAPQLTYVGETTQKFADDTSLNQKLDSYLETSVDAKAQYFFTSVIALDAGVNYDYTPSRDIKNTPFSENSYASTTGTLGVSSVLIPNKLDMYVHGIVSKRTSDDISNDLGTGAEVGATFNF